MSQCIMLVAPPGTEEGYVFMILIRITTEVVQLTEIYL